MKKPPAKRSQPPSNPPQNGQTRIEVQSHSWSAPLPPPGVLSDFDQIVPGSAERIIRAWEVESDHRRNIERREQRSYYRDALIGKSYALIFVLASLSLAAWAVWMNQPWVAALFGAGTITSVVWAFIHRQKPKQ